ncbi:MAG: 2-oxo acid dehydrogenase subunit E2 [Chloroflexi bacterium]|nr:2-oxo acid dehydrogenase subunit E2 [Chloroflexota bacterium]
MKTVEMPKMGDTMEEGKILRWLKKEGDQVKRGDPLAEVETDKVNIEIESFASGVLRKILIPEGASAPIGASIALVGTADEPLPASAGGAATESRTATNGSAPKAEQLKPSATPALVATSQTTAPAAAPGRGRIFISPVARRLAEEHQLDYTQLQGTGPNGRIIKLDIEAALATRPQAPAVQPAPLFEPYMEPATEPLATTAFTGAGDVEIPLTAMRRTIARRMSQSMQAAPHIYVTSVIDTGKLAALRQQINEFAATEPDPIKVSFDALIVKAVALALVRMPEINVSFAEDRLIQKQQINIGVAVSLEQGLIVPVVRNANQRGILDIAREIRRLAEAARTGKLRPEDFSGGTFTISNLGMYEVDSFTAVINQPEAAILAIGSIVPTPVVVDGQVVVRDRMKVTLSADHRAIDGAPAARFLQQIKRLLEEPFGLLL